MADIPLLFLLLICFLFLTVVQSSGFYENNTNYNQEMEVLKKGKEFVLQQLKNESQRNELLCVTFMNGRNSLSNRLLYVNMRRMGDHCDFAVVLYAGKPGDVQVCREAPKGRVVFCERAEVTQQHAPKNVYPKPLLYQDLRPLLPYYKRVFLIDEDVTLFKFNYTIYSAIWNCGFYPSKPPLITQALVSEGTQWFNYVHFDKWFSGRKTLIWAAESVFIEQQAPLINSIFFQWLIEYVLPPTLPLALETGSDWGVDILWCYAAFSYAKHILGYTDPNYVPCALLTKAPPIVHRDGKTIGYKKENFQKFNNDGFRMVDLYRQLYPTWLCSHTEPNFNPLNDENTHLIRRYKLKKECYPHQFKNIL